jgi:DNA-binding CsgD family transcriptional regulator
MSTQLGDDDLHAMLEVVNASFDDLPAAGFPIELLSSLCGVVNCDILSAGVVDASGTIDAWSQEVPSAIPGADDALFWRHYWTSACSYPDRTGDMQSVIKLSDFYSEPELHATGMYIDYLHPLGVEREMIVSLQVGHQQSVRLVFARGAGSDFDERDRAVLALLRPHLLEILRRADDARRDVPDLTPRQWELLRLVAGGCTNGHISRRLCLSEATVRKHLENIFQRLDVTNRTAAVVRAFPERRPA